MGWKKTARPREGGGRGGLQNDGELVWVDADLTAKLRCSLYIMGCYPSTLSIAVAALPKEPQGWSIALRIPC